MTEIKAGDKVRVASIHGSTDAAMSSIFGVPAIGAEGVVTVFAADLGEDYSDAPEGAFYVDFPASDAWVGGEFGLLPGDVELVAE